MARAPRHTAIEGDTPGGRGPNKERTIPVQPTVVSPADAHTLSAPLFARLHALEEGTPEYSYVRNTLVELNMWLVRQAARRCRPSAEIHDDVLQVGTIGLIKAINRFDPTRGHEFEAFAVPTVAGEIKRFFRDATWAVRVPRRLKDCRALLRAQAVAFEQGTGRAPTVAELVERTGLSEEEVVQGLRAAEGYGTVSLDAPAESAADGLTLADRLGGDDPALGRTDDLLTVAPLVAALSDRERAILAMRYLQDMTQSQIGAELGISQMHVSRLLTRTLTTLRAQVAGTT
ncbi:SigB/SigF/SigG family RNA polymerase sigma factor [Streptomyces sp. NPDC091279]|uniref:SigB/SigF/SigG family RNA polymerase sigma factor n=1 Tax=unclassified Streptomyces TaxID=2593676 RepID=UPI003826E81A